VKGTGNQLDYGMRIYDPRLGRFLSADPLIVQEQQYPWYSPYQFAGNKPILYVDIDGLEEGEKLQNPIPAIDMASSLLIIDAANVFFVRALGAMAVGDKHNWNVYANAGALLRDFATGEGEKYTRYFQGDALANEMNRGNRLVTHALCEFKSTLSSSNMTAEEYFDMNGKFHGEYNFSPDHTKTLQESIEKHLGILSNPTDIVFGGMRYTIAPIYTYDSETETKKLTGYNIVYVNEMSRYSLMGHQFKSTDDRTDGGEGSPLSTTVQTFEFSAATDENNTNSKDDE
jgi:RHS repeat-associated protein